MSREVMYKRPWTIREIKRKVPSKAASLLSDPVHLWRAETGIELIHNEPTTEEQKRIWKNWMSMSDKQKEKSDKKSKALFGMYNCSHHKMIMKQRKQE